MQKSVKLPSVNDKPKY